MINAKNVMTTTLFLRIASATSLIFMLGHTAGGLRKWSPMGDNEVLKAMTAARFDTMGGESVLPRSVLEHQCSHADADGTLVANGLACPDESASVRPMIAVITLATVASGVIAWRFIFPVPPLHRIGDCTGGSLRGEALTPMHGSLTSMAHPFQALPITRRATLRYTIAIQNFLDVLLSAGPLIG